MKIDARFDHPVVPPGTSSIIHILLTLTAPKAKSKSKRPDLNIAAVIDRSGSMAGSKLEYAKESVRILLDQLAPTDTFSLVAFDDNVLPLVEASKTADRTESKALVEQIVDGGCTNLSGGWIKGIELVSRSAKKESVNAVLLLTDGQANRGMIEPDTLIGLGESTSKQKNIRTTCLGLGEDFAEDLLRDVSNAAGGRFHYIESPEHAPEVFNQELGGLLAVAAQNVEVELKFADGVTGISQLTGYPVKASGNTGRMIIGDFGADQVKHILLAAELPAITDMTDMLIASMELTYAEVKKDNIQIKSQKKDLIIRVSDDAKDEPADPEVLLHIGIQRAAKARKDAVDQLDHGDLDGAAKSLDAHSKLIRGMAKGASEPDRLNEEAAELNRRANELRERQNMVESRKFMVSEANYMCNSGDLDVRASRTRRMRRPPSAQPRPSSGS
jgi:Ca-activated chloride channel family protein